MYCTGTPNSWDTPITMPPLAVPSSLVKASPVTSTLLVNSSAWRMAFWPVEASSTSNTSCGAPSICLPMARLTFSSSSIRPLRVCRRPAVSMMATSAPRWRAEATVSKATAAGSAPRFCLTTGVPVRSAHTSICSMAAAR
jgi:hypothetical protein